MPTALQMLLGLYGYVLPTLLYVLWSTLALWDIGRRTDLRPSRTWLWTLAIFLLPFLGPLLYFALGKSTISARLRALSCGGGAVVYVVILALGALSGGAS
jgi:hypothetical protein